MITSSVGPLPATQSSTILPLFNILILLERERAYNILHFSWAPRFGPVVWCYVKKQYVSQRCFLLPKKQDVSLTVLHVGAPLKPIYYSMFNGKVLHNLSRAPSHQATKCVFASVLHHTSTSFPSCFQGSDLQHHLAPLLPAASQAGKAP